MDRSKWVAILTGAIAVLLSIGYLLLVQLLDFRGEFKPAPIEMSAILMNTVTQLRLLLGQLTV